METANQRSARAALETARPTMARLDSSRHPEDAAADIVEGWRATETALRELLGGSSLEGQALVREVRQRNLLTLEQGHAVLQFLAAYDRVKRGAYSVTSADIAAARVGFREVEAATFGDTRPPVTEVEAARRSSAGITEVPPARTRRWSPGLIAALVIGIGAIAGLGAWLATQNGGSSAAMQSGIAAYQAGQREKARGEFQRAANDNPESAAPHIYLGRLAREDQDLPTAQRELSTAVKLEPGNASAQREMGSYLFVTGQYALARNFYARAVELDPNDKNALGYLGCTLLRLGQTDASARFLNRAGPGPWTQCTPAATVPSPVTVSP